MKHIEEFYLFVKVIQEGGFSHAAAALDIPTATISRRITQLEEQLGTPLLHRSTRKLRLTDEGLHYYQRLCGPLQQLEQATGEIHCNKQELGGLIKLAAPISVSNTLLIDLLAEFSRAYPQIRFELEQTNDHQQLFDSQWDLVLFSGDLPKRVAHARSLGKIQYALYASPLYLEQHGTPSHPHQLIDHALIYCWPYSTWQLRHSDGETVDINQPGRLSVSQSQAAVLAACNHLGIINAPRHSAQNRLKRGQLVPVLPDWRAGERAFHLLVNNPDFAPLRVRLLEEFIHKRALRYNQPV
ncbi:LysR family transcriptional regulator [Aeromonas diversa]|uniref:LysR family transcriptional regulator n=1 Tax=Aeromonas diversa CDC 2478-85 TaxID=1268237 RepID=N9TZH1_9GAMM|nr:LysR family transcriptional regulator [Aeromonas diversa]ENY71470.1 LysR family transcriptional regulator [Aeromonas diversa CDC 2478-85]